MSLCVVCEEREATPRGKTCSPKCQYELRSQRYAEKKGAQVVEIPTGPEREAILAAASPEEEFYLRKQVSKLRRDLADAMAVRFSDAQYQQFVMDVAERNRTALPPTWAYEASGSRHSSVFLTQLSDIHYEETVDPRVMSWQNGYSPEVASMRLKKYFESVCELAFDHLAGFTWDAIQIVLNGDLITGVIHEELRHTNAMSPQRACIEVATHLRAGLAMLAEEFGTVRVHCQVGNHGRITEKWSHKQAVEHSYDWLIYAMLQESFGEDSDVSIHVSQAVDSQFQIYGYTFAAEHGNLIKGKMDALIRASKAKRSIEQSVGTPYDYLLLADKHTLMFLGSVFVNGSIIGYNEFARDLKLEYERPQQQFLVVDQRYGVTIHGPVFVGSDDEPWLIEKREREAA